MLNYSVAELRNYKTTNKDEIAEILFVSIITGLLLKCSIRIIKVNNSISHSPIVCPFSILHAFLRIYFQSFEHSICI